MSNSAITSRLEVKNFKPRNLIVKVLSVKAPFQTRRDGLFEEVKALLENHPVSVSGFHDSWSLINPRPEYTTTPREKRFKAIQPEFFFLEKEGLLIQALADEILGLSIDAMFIEVDETQKKVQRAWYCTDMRIFGFDSVPAGRDLMRFVEEGTIVASMTFMTNTTGGKDTIDPAQNVLNQMVVAPADPRIKKLY